jgi:hypothetical protein
MTRNTWAVSRSDWGVTVVLDVMVDVGEADIERSGLIVIVLTDGEGKCVSEVNGWLDSPGGIICGMT